MKKLILIFSLCLAFVMTACYDDYKSDYDYTSVYFSYQYPIHTKIVNPSEETIKVDVGVGMGGKYAYTGTETVKFAIVDSLVTKNQDCIDKGLKLMPSSWYTLSNDSIFELKSSNAGSIIVTIVKDSLLAHDDASKNTYAIPFKILSTTIDSILPEKDFSIQVFKLKNEYDGRYYIMGKDYTLDAQNNRIDSANYSVDRDDALVLNKYVYLNTVSKDEVSISRIGSNEDGTKYTMIMKIDDSGKADISAAADNDEKIEVVTGVSEFDFDKSTFSSKYYYTDKETSKKHEVIDVLKYSNTEITTEEWK